MWGERERRGRGGVRGSRWCDWVGGSASLPSPPGARLMPPARPAPRAMPHAPAAARGSRSTTWSSAVGRVFVTAGFGVCKKKGSGGTKRRASDDAWGLRGKKGWAHWFSAIARRRVEGRRSTKLRGRTGVTRGVRGSKMDGSARRLVGRLTKTNTGGNTGCTAGGPRGPKMGSPLSACLWKWGGGGGVQSEKNKKGSQQERFQARVGDAASLPPPPPPLPGDCRRLHRELHVGAANGRGERNGRAVFGREPPTVLAVPSVSRHPFLLVDSPDG